MSNFFLFRTSNPGYIRHASPELEILSKIHPGLITQQEADTEQQRLIYLLENLKTGYQTYEALAQKLKQCRNEAPCKSLVCQHCRRERMLTLFALWEPVLAADEGYAGVTLFFNHDKQTRLPWQNAEVVSEYIHRTKQRVSRVLNRQGCSGPAIGTFSLARYMFDEQEEGIFWVPQLCLLLPNDSGLINGLKDHMSRGGGAYIDSRIMNTPLTRLRIKNSVRMLSCALDSTWYSVESESNDEQVLVKSAPVLLKGKTLAKSLLVLDTLGPGVISFTYGKQPK